MLEPDSVHVVGGEAVLAGRTRVLRTPPRVRGAAEAADRHRRDARPFGRAFATSCCRSPPAGFTTSGSRLILSAVAWGVPVNEPLIQYRQHDGQQIGERRRNLYQQYLRVRGRTQEEFRRTAEAVRAAEIRLRERVPAARGGHRRAARKISPPRPPPADSLPRRMAFAAHPPRMVAGQLPQILPGLEVPRPGPVPLIRSQSARTSAIDSSELPSWVKITVETSWSDRPVRSVNAAKSTRDSCFWTVNRDPLPPVSPGG